MPVLDSGVDDHNLFARLGWNLTDSQTLGVRYSTYHADQTGFGYMDPALIGGDTSALVRILYPYQDFDRATLSYDHSALSSLLADSFQLRGY